MKIAFGPRGELVPLDTQLTKQDEILFMSSGLHILQALSVVATTRLIVASPTRLNSSRHDQPSCRLKTVPSVLAVHQPATLLPISSNIAVLASDPVLSTSASASSDPHASPAPRLRLLT
jgi:hypothetical protein